MFGFLKGKKENRENYIAKNCGCICYCKECHEPLNDTSECIEKDEAIYELEMPGLDKPVLAKTIPFLSSYLSLNDGFLGINTYMREDDMPCIQIFFSKKALNEEQIWKVLTREDWKIKQKDGEFKIIPAKIMFENKGKIL
jgi:hypothetical protein